MASKVLLAVVLLTTGACSSTGGGDGAGEALQNGSLTVHHGDALHSADCQGDAVRRDAQGNPTILQDDGELTAACFGSERLAISFSVESFLDLGPSFDLMNDERVSFYAQFPAGESDGSLYSRAASEHRFQGTFDAPANHVVATLSASYAASTPQSELGTLGAPTTLELRIDFRAE